MNEQNENIETSTPELAALDAGLAELGAAERAGAPAGLEGRIIAATSGTLTTRVTPALTLTRPEPTGVIGRLSVKRLDWPMRVAAVITVMIGGWAVFHGASEPLGGVGLGQQKNAGSAAEADRFLTILSTLENGATSEKIQKLLLDAAKIQAMIDLGGDDFGAPDLSDPENL